MQVGVDTFLRSERLLGLRHVRTPPMAGSSRSRTRSVRKTSTLSEDSNRTRRRFFQYSRTGSFFFLHVVPILTALIIQDLSKFLTCPTQENLMLHCFSENKLAAPNVICGDFESMLPITKAFVDRQSFLKEIKDDDATALTNTLRLLRESKELKEGQVSTRRLGHIHCTTYIICAWEIASGDCSCDLRRRVWSV